MEANDQFDNENLTRVEAILSGHDIALSFFQGELYDGRNQRWPGLTLQREDGDLIELDERTTGRLFMIPDGSMVWALTVGENQDSPAGLEVQSTCPFLAEGEQNSVIAFRDEVGPAIWVNALHIRRLMLAEHAPERLATVAFGLMAITAYRLGFAHISLFAAGNGPIKPDDPDSFIGYDVWPKFGFNAPLDLAELNRMPLPAGAKPLTVQDIIDLDPPLWTHYGSGRTMYFDLSVQSRSWGILLNYLYEVLVEDQS